MSNEVMVTPVREQISYRRALMEDIRTDKNIINNQLNGEEMGAAVDQSVENRKHSHSDAFGLTETGEVTFEKRKKKKQKKQKSSLDHRFSNSRQMAKDKYCWMCHKCGEDVAHPIVWVRLKNYPRWPAKVISLEKDSTLLVSFFGDYDLTTAPIGSVKLHSETRHGNIPLLTSCCQPPAVIAAPTLDPIGSPLSSSEHSSTHTVTPPPPPISPGSPNSSLSTVSGSRSRRANNEKLAHFYPNYRQAMLELDRYVAGLRERWPHFMLPSGKCTDFTRRNVEKYYGSHLYEPVDVVRTSSSGLLPPIVRHVTTSVATATPAASSTFFNSTSSSVQRDTLVHQETRALDSVRSIAQITIAQTAASSVLRKPDNNNNSANSSKNCESSSRPLLIHASLSDQGVLARVAATLRDVRPLCPMPVLPPSDPSPESAPTASQPAEDAVKTVQVIESAPPVSLVPTLSALEPTASQTDETETARQVIDRYRVQLNDMFAKLADRLSSQDTPDTIYSSSSTNTERKVVDAEVQTSVSDCELATLPIKRPCPSLSQSESDSRPLVKMPKVVSVSTNTTLTPDQAPAASNLQVAMMEEEIERLDDEVSRLNVLLNLTRLEMGVETRRRMAELRRVWSAEVTAVLDAAIRIWEQDVVKLIDNVKRKQWCAYCGRVAYYYCCWNTCYCDSVCQSKHWAVHINSCVQARSHQQPTVNTSQAAAANCPTPTVSKFNGSPGVSASGVVMMPSVQTTSPAVIHPATGLPVGVLSQSQVVVPATAVAGVEQQARYRQQQQANWLQHNLPAGVAGTAVMPTSQLPLQVVPRQMDLPQMGGIV